MARPSPISPELEQKIRTLLSDSAYRGHHLREALASLWQGLTEHVADLERITHLRAPAPQETDLAGRLVRVAQQYERQIRQLERVIQISDRYQSNLKDVNTSLHLASTHDHLTGIANRLLVEERCRLEDARADRRGTTYALAMLDVDHFKKFNDSYGHDVGDRVLKLLGDTLGGALRQGDLFARWGGEEFLALLPDATLGDAEQVARRLIDIIRQFRLNHNGEDLAVTISIGVAEHHPGETYQDTFRRADQALLQAKQNGRDCYQLDSADPPISTLGDSTDQRDGD